MDLSFTRFDRAAEVGPPADWAVLMVGVAARQAASPTAAAQALLDRAPAAHGRFAPAQGCFDPATAAALAGWRKE